MTSLHDIGKYLLRGKSGPIIPNQMLLKIRVEYCLLLYPTTKLNKPYKSTMNPLHILRNSSKTYVKFEKKCVLPNRDCMFTYGLI